MMDPYRVISCKILNICSLVALSSVGHGLYAQPAEKLSEHDPLTLFQLLSRADYLVRAQVMDGSGRYAIVEVLKSYKADPPKSLLRIDFREFNLSPKGQGMVVFKKDEEYLLFLMTKAWYKPSEKNANILDLLHGRRGRIVLPPEGFGAILDAVETLVPVTLATPEAQLEGLRRYMVSENAPLQEAALEELIRLRAAVPADLRSLMRLVGDSSGLTRVSALTLLTLIFAATDADHADDERRAALTLVLGSARGDAVESVRIESVRALAAWPIVQDVAGDLRAISKQDSAQSVRYEAERSLFRRQNQKGSGRSSGPSRRSSQEQIGSHSGE